MSVGTLRSRLLRLIAAAFVVTAALLVFAVDRGMHTQLDDKFREVYSEKTESVIDLLEERARVLRSTLVADLYRAEFQSEILKYLRASPFGRPADGSIPFVLDGDGIVLLHPTLPKGSPALAQELCGQRILELGSGDLDCVDADGDPKWCMFRRMEPWGWTVGYSVPLAVKYREADRMRHYLLAALAVIMLIVLAVVAVVLKATTQPIVDLTRAAQGMAAGGLDEEIEAVGTAETVALAESFSRMRDSIRKQIEHLEHEVRERERAEAAHRASEANLRILLDSIGDAVVSTDRDGRIQELNPVATTLTGASLEEARGKRLGDVFNIVETAQGGDGTLAAERVIDTGEIAELAESGEPLQLRARDGTVRWITASAAPVRNRHGEFVGFVLVFRDVTHARRIAEGQRQSQKMESIGQLAGGVAHDFNNMLGGIMGAAELLRMDLPEDDPSRAHVQLILDASARAADLTDQLLTFSRRAERSLVPTDVHAAVRAGLAILSRSVDRRIELVEDLAATGMTVRGVRDQIESAILNMGVNARDAMPNGGTLTVATVDVTLDEAACAASSFALAPGDYVEISVRDSGRGMDAATRERIFEPYFTTKGLGEGTGLGLAAVYGVAKAHGGSVTVESELGVGTCFRLLLPTVSRAAVDEFLAATGAIPGAGVVLVVDDEPSVRAVAEGILTRLGYEVLTAVDGAEALELFRTEHERIDVVLLDVVMPNLNGRDCFRQMLEIDPSARVILTSGFAQEAGVDGLLAEGLVAFLRKPFSVSDLSRACADALAR